jgi:flagellar hook assembly protein FlgD
METATGWVESKHRPNAPGARRRGRVLGCLLGALAAAGAATCGKRPEGSRGDVTAKSGGDGSGVATITYSLTAAGYVSLNIYDASHEVVRELKHAEWQGPGTHVVPWDGNDDEGVPVPSPASCTWKLLQRPSKLTAEYLLSVGANYSRGTQYTSGPPGYMPNAVAIDANNMYVGSQNGDIANLMVAQTRDGSTRVWDFVHPTFSDGSQRVDYFRSMAMAGGVLYVLGATESRTTTPGFSFPQSVYKLDPATGIAAANTGVFGVSFDYTADHLTSEAALIAARRAADGSKTYVAVTYPHKDLIRLYDGDGNSLASYAFTAAQGVTVDGSGAVYASKGEHFTNVDGFDDTRPVAEIDKIPLGGTATPFITTNITTPTVMDIDTSNNTLLVYDGRSYTQTNVNYYNRDNTEGAEYNPQREDAHGFSDPVQQVKRFNLSNPTAIPQRYGVLGGRQEGPYYDVNFTHVADIKADTGAFYVVEAPAAPLRTARFFAGGGLDREFYGGTRIDPPVMVDPDDPTVMYVVDSYGGTGPEIARILVNYTNRTWTVDQTYRYSGTGDGIIHWGYGNTGLELVKHNGTTYFAQSRFGGYPQMVKVDATAGRLVPVTAVGQTHPPNLPQLVPQEIVTAAAGSPTYQWNDINGNGTWRDANGNLDTAEFQFPSSDIPLAAPNAILSIDKDGNFYEMSSPLPGGGDPDGHLYRYSVDWSSGLPKYSSFTGAQAVTPDLLLTTPPRMRGQWGTLGIAYTFHDTLTHEIYIGFDAPVFWPAANDAFFSKWSTTDETSFTYQWSVGKKGDPSTMTPMMENGQIRRSFRRFIGTTHGCYALTDFSGAEGQPNHPSYPAYTYVWDRDGLWVGNLFDQIVTTGGQTVDQYKLSGEVFYGTFYTSADQQTVYFIAPYDNESRIYKITGWDSPSAPWVHLSGNVQQASAAPVMQVTYKGSTIQSDGAPADFGVVPEATNVDQVFTIRNTGTADLEIVTNPVPDLESMDGPLVQSPAVDNTGTYGGDFIVTSQPDPVVIPGGNTTFTVRFVPAAPSGPARTTALRILNNGAVSPFDVEVTGQGTANTAVPVHAFFEAEATGVIPSTQAVWGGVDFRVPDGGSPLTVTALGRFVLPAITYAGTQYAANSEKHALSLVGGVSVIAPASVNQPQTGTQIAASLATVQTAGVPIADGTPGTYQFASERSPVVLAPGTEYYVVTRERGGTGSDTSYWWDLTNVGTPSLGDGTVLGPIVTQNGPDGPWALITPRPTTGLGPTNFKYQSGTITAEPTFGQPPGTYQFVVILPIADATPGATINYTIDGSTPSRTHGTPYSSPLIITTPTIVRAIAFKDGQIDSYVPAAFYNVNQGPAVSLTAPASGTCLLAPTTVTLAASAVDTDSGDAVDRVEFHDGPTLVGTALTSPYQITWTGVPAGSHAVTAVAYDKQGGSSTSTPVTINVLTTQNVGAVTAAGSATYASGTFRIEGGGAGITGTADAFQFTHVPLSGDATVTASVVFAGTSSARAGVMIRQGLAAGDAHASTLQRPTGMLALFTVRATANGSTQTPATLLNPSQHWLRIQRTGNTFASFQSIDGTTWNPIGSPTTVTLTDPVEVGLAVDSGVNSGTAVAYFSNLTITRP